MGVNNSHPPGEAYYVQKPECCGGCKFKCSFEVDQPASLAAVPSSKWTAFQTEVDTNAKQIINQDMLWFILLLGMIPTEGFPLFIIIIVLITGASTVITQKNKKLDDNIRDLCAKFSSETGTSLQYFTQHTGCCKPKGAQVCRVILVQQAPMSVGASPIVGAPVGAPVSTTGPQVITVQVPPDAMPGQMLQIQTASGPMNVTVPPGTGPGQTFQVQIPSVAQAQVVTVQATPVNTTATPVSTTAKPAEPLDEDNPNLEATKDNPQSSASTPPGFFCPIHGRFPGETCCPKCNPPQVN
eukprot:gnl/MRDRNA2_/MRDRNA2_196781_c0_seq1.p1 gnl/MRDRNA2_/MRDRNA2_196781_c0~~gnl/MRDRNA2_/MRDRNA2_196781_c0_seq1.p1  ORF type:complete len:297 (-),score=55.46 gnl/MRDRNA2_/MRDRNA2_196781_c0_seq1:57-947(-)